MKFDMNRIRTGAGNMKRQAVAFYNAQVKARVLSLAALVQTEIIDYPEKKERTRRLILLFTSLFILDYLMYCLHTDKNIADIFPEITPLEEGKTVRVYLPDMDGVTILTERRSIPLYDSDEKKARVLFEMVVKGSMYDNTAMAVPAGLFLRKVWLYGKEGGRNKICVFDLEPAELRSKVTVIKNSESLFRRALEKTVTENIPSVKTIIVLEKGVPDAAIWEL
jgi:hypothetical protein